MYKLDASAFHEAVLILRGTVELANRNPTGPNEQMSERSRNMSCKMLEELKTHTVVLQLPVCAMAIDELVQYLERECTYYAYAQMALNISATFKRELRLRQVYALDAERGQFFETPEIFGADVHTSFPSSAFDITEAGKCYALDRPTACVMHLMRGLETPISLMATDMGVSSDRAAWGPILSNLSPKIASLLNSDPRKQIYSEAAVQFRFFKNAWRDHAMHARINSTMPEALIILNSCKSFMVALSPHLQE